MNIRLAVVLPFVAGLGACMMPMGRYPAGSQQSQSGASGTGMAGQSQSSPASPSPGMPTDPQGPSASHSNSAPAAPSTVSVDIRSDCPKTVKVFYGDKPKFGSGTYSSVESNSVSSHQFQSGDMFWIVDDSQNGVASVTAKPGMSEIKVTSDCTHLSAH